jgi:hypothetical protein
MPGVFVLCQLGNETGKRFLVHVLHRSKLIILEADVPAIKIYALWFMT